MLNKYSSLKIEYIRICVGSKLYIKMAFANISRCEYEMYSEPQMNHSL